MANSSFLSADRLKRPVATGLFLFFMLMISFVSAAAAQNEGLPSDYGQITESLSQATASYVYVTCEWIGFNPATNTMELRQYLAENGSPEERIVFIRLDDAFFTDGEKSLRPQDIESGSYVDVEYDPKLLTSQFVLVHP